MTAPPTRKIDLSRARDALQDAVAACGGKWRGHEFYGNDDVHKQMDTPKGRLILCSRANVFAQKAGIDTSDLGASMMPERAEALANRIEDQCVEVLGVSAWTGKPPMPAKAKAEPTSPWDWQVGQVVEVKQRRVGKDISHGHLAIAAVLTHMVRLSDGTKWRRRDGYEWGKGGKLRRFERRIAPLKR